MILCNVQSIVNQHKHNIIIHVENNIRKTHQKEITSIGIVKLVCGSGCTNNLKGIFITNQYT